MPVMIFDGNCQAHHLAAIFAGAGLAETYCTGEDYGFTPSYRGRASTFVTVGYANAIADFAKANGRTCYQVSQSTQQRDYTEQPYSKTVDAIIRFPFLQQYSIVPQKFYDLYKRVVDVKKIVDYDISLLKLCQNRAGASVDFARLVQEHGTEAPLFNTESHPRGLLTSHLFRHVAAQVEGVLASDVALIADRLSTDECINHTTVHPISHDLLEKLGYQWGEPYEQFRRLLELGAAGNVTALANMLALPEIPFHTDTQALLAYGRAAIALRLEAMRDVIFRPMTTYSPGFMHSWLQRYTYAQMMGDRNDCGETVLEANSFFQKARNLSNTRAWISLMAGDRADARDFALDYLNRTPDRADGFVAYAKVLAAQGEIKEARDFVFLVIRSNPKSELPYIIAQLPSLPELNITPEEIDAAAADLAIEHAGT
jgi:hypothetical protein